MAIVSLALGASGMVLIIPWIPAIILGIVALHQIKRSEGAQGGKVMATIGIILGVGGLILITLLIVAFIGGN